MDCLIDAFVAVSEGEFFTFNRIVLFIIVVGSVIAGAAKK